MSKSLEVKHDELVGTWELSPYPDGPLYCNDGSYDIDWESVQSLSQSVDGASAPSRAARKRRHRQSRKRQRAVLSPRPPIIESTTEQIEGPQITEEEVDNNPPNIPTYDRELLPRARKIS
jgi:hypothetical protein